MSLWSRFFSSPNSNGSALSSAKDFFTLQWHLTDHCNLRCHHCYQEDATPVELTLPDMHQVLEQSADLLTFLRHQHRQPDLRLRFTLTGGEPLLFPHLRSLLEHISRDHHRYEFAILTNGTLIDRQWAELLARYQAAYVQVSIDGPEQIHDSIRGAGSYRRAVEGLHHLRQAGVNSMISFTAHPGNFRHFPHVARLGQETGVSKVWADRLIPCGRGAALAAAVLSPAQTEELFLLMRQAREEAQASWFNHTRISMHRALQFLVGDGKPYRCTAGSHLLALLPGGEVLPCRRLPRVLGRIQDQPLRALYQHPFLQSLRHPPAPSQGCTTCLYQAVCGGGLRCLSQATHGHPFAADPGCWLADRPPSPSPSLESTPQNGVSS